MSSLILPALSSQQQPRCAAGLLACLPAVLFDELRLCCKMYRCFTLAQQVKALRLRLSAAADDVCHSISNSLSRTFTTTWRWMERSTQGAAAAESLNRLAPVAELQHWGETNTQHSRGTTPLRGYRVGLLTFRSRDDGRARGLHRVGVLLLEKASARLGSADVLLGKLKKDISFALRRGTIAQVTTALDAGQRALVRRG
jgi:hypothetical protein